MGNSQKCLKYALYFARCRLSELLPSKSVLISKACLVFHTFMGHRIKLEHTDSCEFPNYETSIIRKTSFEHHVSMAAEEEGGQSPGSQLTQNGSKLSSHQVETSTPNAVFYSLDTPDSIPNLMPKQCNFYSESRLKRAYIFSCSEDRLNHIDNHGTLEDNVELGSDVQR